jgi:hypothetical protein
MDTCGPFPVQTPQGHKFFWTVLDDASNIGSTSLISKKNHAVKAFKQITNIWETKSGNKVIAVRTDGASEFIKGPLLDHFIERGITLQQTVPYAHSQNGKAERYIRTLEDTAQTLLADSGLPSSFWGDVVLTAQYLRIRVPMSTLPANTTPYEMLEKCKPDLSHLRVWGCQCFVLIPEELRSKGGPRMFEAIFVGYEENRIGWHVRSVTGKYSFSRDVIFNESIRGRLSSSSPTIPLSLSPTHPTTSLDSSPSLQSVSPHSSLNSSPTTTSLLPPHSSLNSSPTTTSSSPPAITSPSPLLTSPSPISRLACPRKLTKFGLDWAETVQVNKDRLACLRAARAARSAGISPHDLAAPLTMFAIDDFASLFHLDPLIAASEFSSLASLKADILRVFAGLSSSPDPPQSFSCKPPKIFDPNSFPANYREAVACPDADVWHAAMQREYDGLQE